VSLAKNRLELDPEDDAVYEFIVALAAGRIDDIGEMAMTPSSWRAAHRTFAEDIERFPGELTDPFE
jgi:hypothetical protein